MTRDQARDLKALIFSWVCGEPDAPATEEPTDDENLVLTLRLLELVRDAEDMLDVWKNYLARVANQHGASNSDIGAALGVGKEAVRRRLSK